MDSEKLSKIDRLNVLIKQIREIGWRIKFGYQAIPKLFRVIAISSLVVYGVYSYLIYDREYSKLYDQYYEYYYKAYSKVYPEDIAKISAEKYADYYARYFTSLQYKRTLKYSLPEATPENLSYPTGPVAGLSLNESGVGMIKKFEGFRAEPYKDSGGKITIGFGHLIHRGEVYASVTEQQAETLLIKDIAVAEAIVKRYVKVALNQNQFSALVSLAFNIGEKQFKESTLLKYVNQNHMDLAIIEFNRWQYVDGSRVAGLDRRRSEEAQLFGG